MDYGIVQHASVRLWVVCTADVYLPDPKCLTGEPQLQLGCSWAGLKLGCTAAVLQLCKVAVQWVIRRGWRGPCSPGVQTLQYLGAGPLLTAVQSRTSAAGCPSRR